MNIRRYESRDNASLARIFVTSIRAIPLGDYSAEQLEVWAAALIDLERWLNERAGRVVLVADEVREAVGFATFELHGHIDRLYVHPHFQRRGVASALLEQIEVIAAGLGLARIFTEASVTARPFFEYARFRVIAPQTVIRNGIEFINYNMEKYLRRGD